MDLVDRISGIHLRVQVPGTEIYGELRNRRDISISFGPDSYKWMKDSYLEHSLATVGRLLVAGWGQEYGDAVREAGLEPVPPVEVRNRAYEEAREQVEATGASADGRVTITATGLKNFAVKVTRGTVRDLKEREFVADVAEAATAFLTNHMTQIQELQKTLLG